MKRFWDKVDKSGECWEWTAGKDRDGYGKFTVGRDTFRAHRFVLLLGGGHVPDDMCVCHSCDNPSCVNPDHLWLGTNADNVRDRGKKGRVARTVGEANGWTALTSDDVRSIRGCKGFLHASSLANIFDICEQSVYNIWNKSTWGHIE